MTHQALTERGRIAALGRRFGLVSGALLLAVATSSAFAPALSAFAPTASASPAQLVSTGTAECPATNGCTGSSLATGMTLAVTFNQAPSVTAPFSLTLTDGAGKGTVSSSDATAAVNGSTATFRLTAAPVMSAGTALSLSNLEILAVSGVSSASGDWNLIASGQIDMANVTGSVSCATIAATRFFGGTNCSVGFGAAGPTPPEIYDVIPVPTYDLMGPPEDSAPEVITACQAGSSDTVYDAVTGAQLGADPCGTWLPGESAVGNTTSNTLDYIPTPMLASYEAVAATETLPGSLYVSATAFPPQVTDVTVSGSTAIFTYNMPVRCQQPKSYNTVSQFDYESPWWTTQAANLVWPTAISCPPSAGATTLTLTYNQTLPAAEKFKFEHYGPGYYIVGANGSASYNQVTPSQSMYRGPAALPPNPAITSFTPPTGPVPVTGGPLRVNFGIDNATQCSLGASPSAGVGLSMPYATFTQDPAPSPNAPCPDSAGTATVTLPPNTTGSAQSYTITLTAASLPGTTQATQSIVLVVPTGVITQSAPTSAVTLAGAAYAGQLTTNDPSPVTFTQTSGTPSITVSSAGAVSALSTLQVGTYTASGSDSDGIGAAGSWSFTLNVHPAGRALVAGGVNRVAMNCPGGPPGCQPQSGPALPRQPGPPSERAGDLLPPGQAGVPGQGGCGGRPPGITGLGQDRRCANRQQAGDPVGQRSAPKLIEDRRQPAFSISEPVLGVLPVRQQQRHQQQRHQRAVNHDYVLLFPVAAAVILLMLALMLRSLWWRRGT